MNAFRFNQALVILTKTTESDNFIAHWPINEMEANISKSALATKEHILEDRARFAIINIFNNKYDLFLKLKDRIVG
jgi:hypothetical protein